MKVGLLCGEKPVELELPDTVRLLDMKPMPSARAPERAVRDALSDPIQSLPLSRLARGRKDACIVISDVTRPVPNKVILPPLLEALDQSGIPRDRITILIATGMHRPNLGDELASMVGRDIMEGYRIVNHFCRKPEEYRKIAEIEGAPIEINKHYLDADFKILTGLIEPHFYAGYSGGRKAILPGISSFETMKFMHSYAMIAHPKVTNCLLDGNPFHDYGLKVTAQVGADFILNVVINKDREIGGVFAGHYDGAHRAGCAMVEAHSVASIERPVDMVITSGGGYPLDATFYQISKALICARDMLKKGGTIVVACECREGLGSPEFCGILRSVCSPREFFEGYCEPKDFVIDQWCAQNVYQALDHAGAIYIYSPCLQRQDVERMGARKVDHLQETVNALLRETKEVVVVPEGPYVVGKAARSFHPSPQPGRGTTDG
jgi:nickel-dependent lactate racemase